MSSQHDSSKSHDDSFQWTCVRSVSQDEEMNPQHRQSMEDAHLAVDQFGGVESQGFFAVFDGHGGRGVVDYLAKHFEKNFLNELTYDGDNRSVEECFMSAYLITDIQTSQNGLKVSGSTAVTCLLRNEKLDGSLNGTKKMLHCANVGDSRAVLCRAGGTALRLSYDHKATDKFEVKRIEDCGGFIMRKRVLGILSVTRSFGDHAMKKFVTARPYTMKIELTSTDEFLIIACDGVWDVLTDEEAVSFVREAIKAGNSGESLAKVLVEEAMKRTSTDNITALVIVF